MNGSLIALTVTYKNISYIYTGLLFSTAALKTNLPILPNPLIPRFTDIIIDKRYLYFDNTNT